MADYSIDNINLLISQRRLSDGLNADDNIFVGSDALIFTKQVLYGSYYDFRVKDFNNGSYCFTIVGKLNEEIYHNSDKMIDFFKSRRTVYKNKVSDFEKRNSSYSTKEMLIKDLCELDNSEYLKNIKEFLKFFNPEILKVHELMFTEIIDGVN